jgi:NADH-quinone oxidoreductase subunit E
MGEEKLEEKVEKAVNELGDERSPLISLLQRLQESFGYIPGEALPVISEKLKVPESRIWEIVTFYSQFSLEPKGRNEIRVCLGTACHVKGSKRILEKVEKTLGIKAGETTADHRFSIETVRCLGTCFLAPVMMINSEYYGKMSPEKVDEILKRWE